MLSLGWRTKQGRAIKIGMRAPEEMGRMGFKDLAAREGACYGLPFFSSSFHMLFGRAGTSRFSLLSSSFFPPSTSTCFLDYTPHIPFFQVHGELSSCSCFFYFLAYTSCFCFQDLRRKIAEQMGAGGRDGGGTNTKALAFSERGITFQWAVARAAVRWK